MFIERDQHYQTYNLESHQRCTTIRKLTTIASRACTLARPCYILLLLHVHACVCASAGRCCYCVFIQNSPGSHGTTVLSDLSTISLGMRIYLHTRPVQYCKVRASIINFAYRWGMVGTYFLFCY